MLDTNVVIAGLLWAGPPHSLLLRATERQDIVLATSPVLMSELADTRAAKSRVSGSAAEEDAT